MFSTSALVSSFKGICTCGRPFLRMRTAALSLVQARLLVRASQVAATVVGPDRSTHTLAQDKS